MNVGILGGGQLGRMLALAGIPLGVRCRVLDPDPQAPAAVAAEHIRGDFADRDVLARLADGMDLVTYEFENVPVSSAQWLAERVPVYPPPAALEVSQERLTEKRFFERIGVSTPPFASAENHAQFDAAIREIGLPAVVKTRRFGYDGKGQTIVRTGPESDAAWQTLGDQPLIVEAFVPFDRELSILAVRGRDGDVRFYPLVQNTHRCGILRESLAPAPGLTPELQSAAELHARKILAELRYVGVLAIELFEVNGRLLANEMAPRVHNSGHWTIEGAATSQFENHLRAILGLPLGDCAAWGHSAMLNLIGELPDIQAVLRVPAAHLHLYGKLPRLGRKLGHVTVTAASHELIQPGLEALNSLIP